MKTIPNFKIRASASGALMTDPKGKTNLEKYNDACDYFLKIEIRLSEFKNQDCKTAVDIRENKIPEIKKIISDLEKIKDKKELSETSCTYVQEWLKEHIYGVRKQINNKYLSKGLVLEDTAIDKAIEWLDLPMTLKNETFYEDDFFCGTPDLIVNDTVLDIKCSWDCFTFPLFENEIPTKNYYYQLQVYMHLSGLKKAKLVYVLLNTPEELTYEEKHNYDNLDKEYRIKTFDVNYDVEVIEELKLRVLNVREYIKQLSNE